MKAILPSTALTALGIPAYSRVSDLAVITTYFNPCGYRKRRENLEIFMDTMRRSGIMCVTVECAFNGRPFDLPNSLDVIQVHGASLWQKERLLNLAASWLPKNIKNVAWLDCDVLFTNPNWAVDTVRLLETHAVVQVFETCLRLEQDYSLGTDEVTSFGAIVPNQPHTISCGRFDSHGHTGYGWAMRREIFDQVGLYEYAVTGSADHYMAHAIYGDYGHCIEKAVRGDRRQIEHLKEWGAQFHELVQGKFCAVPGKILHLWHGDLKNRRYLSRMHDTTKLGYDPYVDIHAAAGKPFTWHPEMNKPELREYFGEYFESRREDG